MNTSKINKEALNFFLDNDKMSDSIDNPDEGIDYVFMLDFNDWTELEIEWDRRDEQWRTAMTYLAGNVTLQISGRILFKSITDSNPEIIAEGLLAIHQIITEEIENKGIAHCEFLTLNKELILKQIQIMKDDFNEYPEFEELQDILMN